jgi:hypothetical protein
VAGAAHDDEVGERVGQNSAVKIGYRVALLRGKFYGKKMNAAGEDADAAGEDAGCEGYGNLEINAMEILACL